MGRLFDGVFALITGRRTVTYEGQGAILLEAMAKNTRRSYPCEYEIKEDFDRLSDNVYRDMIRVVRSICSADVRKTIVLSAEEKLQIAEEIRRQTAAPMWQIAKFLHIR